MSISPRCEQCAQPFAPLEGGICAACGRLLCGAHLRGWLRRFLLPPLPGTGRPVCVACRRAGAATAAANESL